MKNFSILNHIDAAELEKFRQEFQSAKPFKHICVENFFNERFAEDLLRDFPVFDPSKAKNEFGKLGGKATRQDLVDISENYRELYEYMNTPEFLGAMSRMTGIPDLMMDPALYGGGTHENLHGQDLDPHVDFNRQLDEGLHRRLNLIVYLNREWEEDWGGSIEIHSNPRRPDENVVRSFLPIFNRCVAFETNEYSWHGFEKIQLPENKRHDSRKSVSIYLYTRERPAEEIFPEHGTFYVQRPLSKQFVPGHRLSEEDVNYLAESFRRRDSWIEKYQKMEVELGGIIAERDNYLKSLLSEVRLPVTGYALQAGKSTGFFADGWASKHVEVTFEPSRPVKEIQIRGWVADRERDAGSLLISLDGTARGSMKLEPGHFACALDMHEKPLKSEPFTLTLDCSTTYNSRQEGTGDDDRNLSYILSEIRLEHVDE